MNFDAPLHMQPCCRNIRHKMMYCDPRQATPGMIDGSSETRVLLCVLTQEVLGPDDKPVSLKACTPDRPCYCGAQKPESWADRPRAEQA